MNCPNCQYPLNGESECPGCSESIPSDYESFINSKTHLDNKFGFEPSFMPDKLFSFQKALVTWATRKGRAAIFADCGLGKTFMQLTWAENVARHTQGRVLVLTPLAVCFQTVSEGTKLGIEVIHRREGIEKSDRIIVTNYERLHYFHAEDFVGCVCDESSILKNADGVTRQAVTNFMRKLPYRQLDTATAAPNDYPELGTSSEALGYLGHQDMLNKFFRREKDFVKLFNSGGQGYEMRPYAEKHFWQWVVSWARALRKPSDLGFEDNGFILPELIERQHVVKASKPRGNLLFDIPAIGLAEQREDLRNTINERCELAASLINQHNQQAIAWGYLNAECDKLEKLISGCEQVAGKDSEERKEKVFREFIAGNIRVLVTKPEIGGLGLNFQNCGHQTFFPSHSYEQYYQCKRRSWRYGRKLSTTIDMITTDGQENVMKNLQRKSEQADKMFSKLVELMNEELNISKRKPFTQKLQVPSFL